MRLTLLIPAINGEQELARILPQLSNIGDELVIGIDDTTTDRTADVARRYTDRIYPVPHEGFRGRGRPDDLNAIECLLPYCRGDWVLRVDQDETLSPQWRDRTYVNKLLDDPAATHYWIPRRLVVPSGGEYVCSGILFPDFQLRLYRNIPSLIQFNRRPHDPPRIAGEQRYIADSWIVHWDSVWHDSARRQEKIQFNRELGYAAGEFDPPDFSRGLEEFPLRPLDFTYPSASRCLTEAPVTGDPFAVAIEILDCPPVMRVGTSGTILIALKNCSNRILYPSSQFVRPGNMFLSYHWSTDKGQVYWWDYERHELPGPLPPGAFAERFLSIFVPKEPGDYFFQPDLVEENVSWVSWHYPIPGRAVRLRNGAFDICSRPSIIG
jgi:hypothetical protein